MNLRGIVTVCGVVCLLAASAMATGQLFSKPITSATLPTTGGAMVIADFDGDGILDIVVGSSGSDDMHRSSVGFHKGFGDGTFGPGIITSGQFGPSYALAAADFDNDGKPDLFVADGNDGIVSVLKNLGDGNFAFQATYVTGGMPRSAAAADFNKDGWADAVVATTDGRFTELKNNGDGTFMVETRNSLDYAFGLAVADFNTDGTPDLATVSYATNYFSVQLGTGLGGFTGGQTYHTSSFPQYCVSGDFTGDGLVDLAILCPISDSINIFRNIGDGKFVAEASMAVPSPIGAVAIDVNNDGLTDLVVSCTAGVAVLYQSGGKLMGPITIPVGAQGTDIASGDFNGDGLTDIVLNKGDCAGPPAECYHMSVFVNAGCCPGTTGDVNSVGIVDLSDLTSLVSYLTGGGFIPPCSKSANVDGQGIVDSADLAALVSYLTGGGFVLPHCS